MQEIGQSDTPPPANTAIDKPAQPPNAVPLTDAIALALMENQTFIASRKGTKPFTSPMFGFARLLQNHSELQGCSAKEAFEKITAACVLDWAKEFPDVTVPSLEFVTAWEQIKIPAGADPLKIAMNRVTETPLKLLDAPCEGFELYLALAFHLQRLNRKNNILLPVKQISGCLTTLMGKAVSQQNVSNYCRLAKNRGYLTTAAKAHHPSGKAAKYKFFLNRFTDDGVELPPTFTAGDADSDFSYGMQGIDGNNGSDGNEGSYGIKGSGVLTNAKPTTSKNTGKEYGKNNKDKEKESSAKEKERSEVVAAWVRTNNQVSKGKYHKPLPIKERSQLGHLSRVLGTVRACAVIEFAIRHWSKFASSAAAAEGLTAYAIDPHVGFLLKYHAHAVNGLAASEEASAANAQWKQEVEKGSKLAPVKPSDEAKEGEKPYKATPEQLADFLKQFES